MKLYIVESGEVKTYGATKAIQNEIDKAFLSGGGAVIVSDGEYRVSTIRLRSRVSLILKKGVRLVASKNPDDYKYSAAGDIEPLENKDLTDVLWEPWNVRKNYDFMTKPGSRWNAAIIKAIDAENISIIGEEGSYIDGSDCYDPSGEECYRGPHAVNMHRCENITLSGYTVKNSANWAHALFFCKNVKADNVTVLAGHDGIHVTSCDNVSIKNCKFETGDDCVAGIDNVNVFVSDSEMNTACSALRFGGTNVIVSGCRFTGPARYLFRGGLSEEEKKSGVLAENKGKVYNMLSAYMYYSDFSRPIRYVPGNILIENCVFYDTTRFLHYNFSGNEPWQRNRPLGNITFKNIKAEGISMPLTLYGDETERVTLKIEDSEINLKENFGSEFIRAANYDKIVLKNVKIKNFNGEALVKKWSDGGEVILRNADSGNNDIKTETTANEPFVCKTI